MAGHSHAANIKHRKGNQDAKKGANFTKLANKIYVYARSCSNPDMNPNLRTAIRNAQAASVPKSTIENAIKKASNSVEQDNLVSIRYNANLGQITFIIETLTDNRNRTASQLRSIMSDHEGEIVETGKIEYMFDNIGTVLYDRDKYTEEEIFNAASKANCIDFEITNDNYIIYTNRNELHNAITELVPIIGEANESALIWKPKQIIDASHDTIKKVLVLISELEDNPDVQDVFTNIKT